MKYLQRPPKYLMISKIFVEFMQIENFDHLILNHEKNLDMEDSKPLENIPKMNKMQFAVYVI